ncbi:MAG TPA: hypothetical protein VGM50_13600 [Gemmatimonadaceae bacterium]|jgi:hypothetical protein
MTSTTRTLKIGSTEYELRLESKGTIVSAQAFLDGEAASPRFNIEYELGQLDAAEQFGIDRQEMLKAILQSAINYVRENVKSKA